MVSFVFSGDRTIHNSASTYSRLLEGLASPDPVVWIDCGGIEEVDLCFVQLILAARKSLAAARRDLRLTAPAGGPLLDVLRRGGFLTEDGGNRSQDEKFWLEGEQAE